MRFLNCCGEEEGSSRWDEASPDLLHPANLPSPASSHHAAHASQHHTQPGSPVAAGAVQTQPTTGTEISGSSSAGYGRNRSWKPPPNCKEYTDEDGNATRDGKYRLLQRLLHKLEEEEDSGCGKMDSELKERLKKQLQRLRKHLQPIELNETQTGLNLLMPETTELVELLSEIAEKTQDAVTEEAQRSEDKPVSCKQCREKRSTESEFELVFVKRWLAVKILAKQSNGGVVPGFNKYQEEGNPQLLVPDRTASDKDWMNQELILLHMCEILLHMVRSKTVFGACNRCCESDKGKSGCHTGVALGRQTWAKFEVFDTKEKKARWSNDLSTRVTAYISTKGMYVHRIVNPNPRRVEGTSKSRPADKLQPEAKMEKDNKRKREDDRPLPAPLQLQSRGIDKVQTWLEELGAGESVRAKFAEHEIDVEALVKMTDAMISATVLVTGLKLRVFSTLMSKATEDQKEQEPQGGAAGAGAALAPAVDSTDPKDGPMEDEMSQAETQEQVERET